MAGINCIYKSVTMSAGETFVLPPGAELISVSDIGAVTSSCPDPLPNVEMKCWKIRWVDNIDPQSSGPGTLVSGATGIGAIPVLIELPTINNAWDNEEGGPITIDKISILGTVTDTTGLHIHDLAGLENAIAGSPSGSILTDRKYKSGENLTALTSGSAGNFNNNYDAGYRWSELWFKASQESAETVYLQFLSASDNIGNNARFFANEEDCEAYPTTSDLPTC